jgi:hypothetical protein
MLRGREQHCRSERGRGIPQHLLSQVSFRGKLLTDSVHCRTLKSHMRERRACRHPHRVDRHFTQARPEIRFHQNVAMRRRDPITRGMPGYSKYVPERARSENWFASCNSNAAPRAQGIFLSRRWKRSIWWIGFSSAERYCESGERPRSSQGGWIMPMNVSKPLSSSESCTRQCSKGIVRRLRFFRSARHSRRTPGLTKGPLHMGRASPEASGQSRRLRV